MSPNGRPQDAQTLPAYHRVRMLRTRQSWGDAATWARHSCPHPARSGQREQEESRNSSVLLRAVAAACLASTTTPAGLRLSGQVITRLPRYFRSEEHTSELQSPDVSRMPSSA